MPVTINGSSGITAADGVSVFTNSQGNVGIGTSSPGALLHVSTGTQESVRFTRTSTNSSAYVTFYANNSSSAQVQYAGILGDVISSTAGSHGGALLFYTTGSGTSAERARIDSSGNLLVGKTTAGENTGGNGTTIFTGSNAEISVIAAASTSAQSGYTLYSSGAGAYRFYVGMQGQIYATNTTISAISDQRFKENIQDLDVGLGAVMALKPRKFDWKEGKGKDIKGDRGFIAQEFEQVFPDMIDEWRDPAPEGEEPYKSVRADLIPVLVKAIQELNAKVEAQAAEIVALKGSQA